MRTRTRSSAVHRPNLRRPRRHAAAAAVLTLLATGVIAGGVAHAAELEISHCRFPDAPTVPDGADASESDMGQAGAEVREYVSGVQSSLECLTAAETAMGDEISEEQRAQLVVTYNQGVDQMNAVAQRYNEQVRAFKER